MNRAQRRALKRLPTSSSRWEFLLIGEAAGSADADIEGMLLVVERDTSNVRYASQLHAGQSLWPILQSVLCDPFEPCQPAKPRLITCSDPDLASRLRKELGKLVREVRVERELPVAREVAQDLFGGVASPKGIGLDRDLPDWAHVLRALVKDAPWRTLDDDVVFAFSGPKELSGKLATVLGLSGVQRGVTVFPDHLFYDSFRLFMELDGGMESPRGRPLNLFLEPRSDMSPDLIEQCQSSGLLIDDLGARALSVSFDGLSALSASEQRQLLAAVQAVQATYAAHGPSLKVSVRSHNVRTVLGEVHVQTCPSWSGRPDGLAGKGHMAMPIDFTDEHGQVQTPFLIKLAKRDAMALALKLAYVDELRLEPGAAGVNVFAVQDGQDLGLLTVLENPAACQAIVHRERGVLWVAAGGAKRMSLHRSDVLLEREVRFDRRPLDRWGPVLPAPLFEGPVESWPKASDTLASFASPILTDQSALKVGLELSMAIWNAVGLRDYKHDGEAVRLMFENVPGGSDSPKVLGIMVRRKMRWFRDDPRLFKGVEYRAADGRVYVESVVLDGPDS